MMDLSGTTERAKILIIDDEPMNIQILSKALPADSQVFFATGGEQGLKICHEQHPDLVLLDVMMPGMDGYQVCETIRQSPELQDIPVIFVSALSAMEEEVRGLELGAVDYIAKPINPAIVRMRVKNQLELKRYRDILHRLAYVDGLTGLANRRYLDDALGREWRRSMRNGTALSLLMIDVDCFKSFNDHFGHQQGDEVLRRVGAALRDALHRAGDMVARYGGEEFVCLLPDTDCEAASALAEELRQQVLRLGIKHPYCSPAGTLSVSIGVASAVAQASLSLEELIKAADSALYEAKHKGRNRVESCPLNSSFNVQGDEGNVVR